MLQPNALLLFQGDSVTNAFRMPDEVSTAYQMGAGYAMIVAAHLMGTCPDLRLRCLNRGVSGNNVSDMAARWQEDCLALQPDILSILIGVNDTLQTISYGGDRPIALYEQEYRALLTRTRAALPAVRLILGESFLLPCGIITQAHLDDLRPRQEITRALAEEFGATFVPLQEAFLQAAAVTGPEYWLFDGIHPNAAGQWLIANAWLKATGSMTDTSPAGIRGIV